MTCVLSTLTCKIQAAELKEYQIPGSKVHLVDSKIVGQRYELSVALPASYEEKPEQKYPVVYVMDGQWNFSIMASINGKLFYDGMTPEVIIVGVTWGGEGDDANVLRARDFTPSAVPQIPNSGGAKKFLMALEKELIPYIEKHYRNNEDRVITGSSLGGLFVSYALLETPYLFNKYIASAPAYQLLPDELTTKKLTQFKTGKLLHNTRIFIGCGLLDQCAERSKTFSQKLNALKSKKLEVELYLAKDLGHAGVEPISYTYGLQSVFKRPFFAISDKTLSKYIGTYVGENGFSVDIVVEKNGLLAHQSNGVDTHLLPESNNLFYVKGSNVTAEMIPTENGQFSVMVNSRGNVLKLKRTK